MPSGLADLHNQEVAELEYTIQKLAKLAGISTRTLRYYDEKGLLTPARINSSGYRIYGPKEVDTLQQILFYKELGMNLADIRQTIHNPDFRPVTALKEHLAELQKRQEQLSLLIVNVTTTIQKEEGKMKMNDKEKFIGLKEHLVKENEEKYGEEVRTKYGSEEAEKSNAKLMNLTEEAYQAMQKLGSDIQMLLQKAVLESSDPSGALGLKIASMHKEWLLYTWSAYTKKAHRGVAQMYVADERFKTYYDSEVDGCAEFLKNAIFSL